MSARLHCELLGAADSKHIQTLNALLTGLSGHPGVPVNQRELSLKSQVSPFTELKLVQQLPVGEGTTHDSWKISHEGVPVRGKGYAELPAIIRNQTKASLQGAHTLSFWTHLGFSASHELNKEGFTFAICHDDQELKVLLCSVAPSSSSQQQCAEHIQGICNAYWLIRITADVPEAQAIPAAHAIGSLSKYLEPIVEFRKE